LKDVGAVVVAGEVVAAAMIRLSGAAMSDPPQKSGSRIMDSSCADSSIVAIAASSIVPHALITNAFDICANARESAETREYCTVNAKIASGLEFSPHVSALAGPNRVLKTARLSPSPPVWTSRSPTVGMTVDNLQSGRHLRDLANVCRGQILKTYAWTDLAVKSPSWTAAISSRT